MADEGSKRSFSAWVDLFRWLAALCVLLTHTGIRMLPPVQQMPHRSWLHIAYAFAAGFDHQAVMVFFVLSGLLVGGAVTREVAATGTLAFGRYLLKRAVRLGIVLWPALAVAAVADSLAISGGAVAMGILPPDITSSLSLPVLACNMVLLQTAACVQFGGVGALWSLFNEGWYYLIFPAVALALLAPWPRTQRLALGAVAAAALAGLTAVQFTGSPIGPYMLVWSVGAAVATMSRPLTARPSRAALLFAMLLLAIRLLVRRSFATDHPIASAELDLLLALAFGNLLLTLRFCSNLPAPPWPALQRALAGFSFSLYCTHIPILVLCITGLMRWAGLGWQMHELGWRPWLAITASLTACIGFAYAFSRLTEVHTDAVRQRLAARAWFRPRALQ